MKKAVAILLCIIMLFSVCVLSACENADYTIGILQVATHEALDKAREGFKDTLTQWATEQGKTISFDEQNAQGKADIEDTCANVLAGKNHDLLLGIATSSAQALSNKTESVPVLFTAVTDPVEAGLEGNEGPENVTGTSDLNPIEEQIELLIQVALAKNPSDETITVAFVYCSSEINSHVQVEVAKDALDNYETEQGQDIDYVDITCAEVADIQTTLDAGLTSDVDVIYIPTDNLMASNVSLIGAIADDKNIPIVAGEQGMCCDGGCTATVAVDYYQLGVQTALMAIEILSGEKTPSQIEFEYFALTPIFFINEENALGCGLNQNQISQIKSNWQN